METVVKLIALKDGKALGTVQAYVTRCLGILNEETGKFIRMDAEEAHKKGIELEFHEVELQ